MLKNRSGLLVLAMMIQIFLVTFAPPFRFGLRHVFPSDLWAFVWIPLATYWLFKTPSWRGKKNFLWTLGALGSLLLVVLLHGSFRPSLHWKLYFVLIDPVDDTFSLGRESVVAFRFWNWFWGGLLVFNWFSCPENKKELPDSIRFLQNTLALCTVLAVAVMVLVRVYPIAADTLGKIYDYNPHYSWWAGRICGIFHSPVEGSLALGFTFLLLLNPSWTTQTLWILTLCATLLGIFLTQTITALAAGVISAAVVLIASRWTLKRWIALGSFGIASSIALYCARNQPFLQNKWSNLIFRVRPWKVFWESQTSRWDLFTLGTGFPSQFSDSIYVFLFTRGGILLLLLPVFWFGRRIFHSWKSWTWQQKLILVFLLISGLTVDNLILRPISTLIITLGVPLLCFRHEEIVRPIQDSLDVTILGIRISRLGLSNAIVRCTERISQRRGGYVCFANAHSLTEAVKNFEIHQALSKSFLTLADGMPLIWISRLKRCPISSRACGPDFMKEFLTRNSKVSHGFLGGTYESAQTLARTFGINAISYSPPMREFSKENVRQDWENLLKRCPDLQPPPVVWVGLGAPKQELWMQEAALLAPQVLFLGVGAAFDFLTDRKQRAPMWMQRSGLEWLYRLSREPKRLWRRYLISNSLFITYVVLEFLGFRNHLSAHRG